MATLKTMMEKLNAQNEERNRKLDASTATSSFAVRSFNRQLLLPSVVEERPGLLILVEQSSFGAFHHDLHEEGDAFLTLLRGRKLWLICNLSNVARELDRLGRDRREAASKTLRYLQSQMKTMAKQVFWGLLEPGQSLYLRYGWSHSVWTDVEEERVQQLTLANNYTAVACRWQQPGGSQQSWLLQVNTLISRKMYVIVLVCRLSPCQ